MAVRICEYSGPVRCTHEIYNKVTPPLCKHHFMKFIRGLLRREFRNLYRHPDMAFGALDMTGIGRVDLTTLLESLVCKNIQKQRNSFGGADYKVSKHDLKQYLESSNIFETALNNTLGYQVFKKNFFP